ncbi:hypothetical protein RhiLY_10423 [Ceratobasidium sp. AG-Ba]|nr:hypothetical protein RhiLY_10423 [Ceratobasidium sp. AG-Ba]
MIFSAVANHGCPPVQSEDTNNPAGLPNNVESSSNYEFLLDESVGEPASKRPVLEWHNPFNDPNALGVVDDPTHGIRPYFDSLRAGFPNDQSAEVSVNKQDQQTSINPYTEQAHLLPSPHQMTPAVSHPLSTGYLSTGQLSSLHSDPIQRPAVPEPEIEMMTFKSQEPGVIATRSGKTWSDEEKYYVASLLVGPDMQIDTLVLLCYTPRRSTSAKSIPVLWFTLWNKHFKLTRELSAVMREGWTLVDTFHDIFSLIKYASNRNGVLFDQCKARFLQEPNSINLAIEEAKAVRIIPLNFKALEVVLWLQNEWFDWFQARGIRTCPETQRSGIAQLKGPPSQALGSQKRKKSSYTVTSTASLPASLPSRTPASQPASSAQPTNRLHVPSGIFVPSAAVAGAQSPVAMPPGVPTAAPDMAAATSATPRILSRVLCSQSVKRWWQSTQAPENTASLAELVCQNKRLIELFEQNLENKWSDMKRAQIAESEAAAAWQHKELLESVVNTVERFAILAREDRINHRTLMYNMMRNEKASERARRSAEDYLIDLPKNKTDFVTLNGLVAELIKVIGTRDKSAAS